jgi:hypothetical protein
MSENAPPLIERMEDLEEYVERKEREIALINGLPCCAASDRALRIGGRDHRLEVPARQRLCAPSGPCKVGAVTETARPEIQRWRWGAYRFSFGYQRADLKVTGPAIYRALAAKRRGSALGDGLHGAGMSAIAVVLSALCSCGRLNVFATRGYYGETRELMESLAPRR